MISKSKAFDIATRLLTRLFQYYASRSTFLSHSLSHRTVQHVVLLIGSESATVFYSEILVDVQIFLSEVLLQYCTTFKFSICSVLLLLLLQLEIHTLKRPPSSGTHVATDFFVNGAEKYNLHYYRAFSVILIAMP
jgi:hypothetical protein